MSEVDVHIIIEVRVSEFYLRSPLVSACISPGSGCSVSAPSALLAPLQLRPSQALLINGSGGCGGSSGHKLKGGAPMARLLVVAALLAGGCDSLSLQSLATTSLRRVVVGSEATVASLTAEPLSLGSLWQEHGAVVYVSRRPA